MTGPGNRDGLTEHRQRLESSLYHVMRIGRSQRLCQNVRYTGAFQHGAHRTSGNNTRTMSSGSEQYLRRTFLGQLIVRDRTVHDRNLDQVLLCVFDPFRDRFLDFLSLTQTMTDYTAFIADYHQGREAESPSAFRCFHNAIDSNHLLLQLQVTGFLTLV